MTPGGPAICEGTVLHRRTRPEDHRFTVPVSHVWVDPDRPDELCDRHPLWSARRAAPVRLRRGDYGTTPAGSLVDQARAELGAALGRRPAGPVRMLTQPRRLGWLFNPITIFFVWDDPTASPVGVILEVTNTPWHERTRYPVALRDDGDTLVARFDKIMHVSPFLEMEFEYRLRVRDVDDRIAVDLDVVDGRGHAIVTTRLRLGREVATRRALGRSLRRRPFATHRVSAGIHHQAARLWAKGVAFVRHPARAAEVAR